MPKSSTYVQFGQDDSQVFVFMSPGTDFFPAPHLVCALCYMGDVTEGWEHRATTTDCMLNHLYEHINKGHRVPDYVIPELIHDDKDNFPDG